MSGVSESDVLHLNFKTTGINYPPFTHHHSYRWETQVTVSIHSTNWIMLQLQLRWICCLVQVCSWHPPLTVTTINKWRINLRVGNLISVLENISRLCKMCDGLSATFTNLHVCQKPAVFKKIPSTWFHFISNLWKILEGEAWYFQVFCPLPMWQAAESIGECRETVRAFQQSAVFYWNNLKVLDIFGEQHTPIRNRWDCGAVFKWYWRSGEELSLSKLVITRWWHRANFSIFFSTSTPPFQFTSLFSKFGGGG